MGESGPRRPGLRPTDQAAAWSALHHGLDPARVPLLSGWLRAAWFAARPLARRGVPPTAVTVLGALLAIGSVPSVAVSSWLAVLLVLTATACDALDGAVAVLASRATPFGAVADKVADRIADTAFALVLWRCGAPLWLAVAAAAVSLVLEALREVRGAELRARLTAGERPTRVICTAIGCVAAAMSSAAWPVTVCAAVWAALGLVALVQLARQAPAAGRSG